MLCEEIVTSPSFVWVHHRQIWDGGGPLKVEIGGRARGYDIYGFYVVIGGFMVRCSGSEYEAFYD